MSHQRYHPKTKLERSLDMSENIFTYMRKTGSIILNLIYNSFEHHSQRRHQFRCCKLPHECHTWISPTAHSRGREKYATKNKSDFDTTKVGIEQHVEFFTHSYILMDPEN